MSFDDLFSLASVFSSDVRRALLALQTWLGTGSSFAQRIPAPVYKPPVASVPTNVGVDVKLSSKSTELKGLGGSTKQSGSHAVDSGDEFVVARKRKRRALCVVSSDEDSQSLSGIPTSIASVVVDNTSSHGCENSNDSAGVDNCQQSVASDSNVAVVTNQPVVAMEAKLAPPIHRLSCNAIGGLELLPHSSRVKLQVSFIHHICQLLVLLKELFNFVFHACYMFLIHAFI